MVPVKVSPLPMATWSGAILLPNSARRASTARIGSALSRSQRVMANNAGLRRERPSPMAVSAPVSVLAASIVMSAESTAVKPSMTSPTKSA